MEIIYNGKSLRRKDSFPNFVRCFNSNLFIVVLYIILFGIQINCQTLIKDESSQNISVDSLTKTIHNVENNIDAKIQCHSCLTSSYEIGESKLINKDDGDNKNEDINSNIIENNDVIEDIFKTFGTLTEQYILKNKTEQELETQVEKLLDEALSKDRYIIFDGIEIKTVHEEKRSSPDKINNEIMSDNGRALFSTYTYEYRLLQKFKNFVDTHILSINIPKAANLIGFRSFGLKKFFVPLLIGAQVFKSIILAMFLPSILGSFGKILGKGISQLSASSSQASYPPANVDDQDAYNNENKDVMGYESDPSGTYAYPDGQSLYADMADTNNANNLANVDLSRFGVGGQKVFLPSKNSYYKNQMTASNNYKVFQKIPASSMILSNYDPFYSPLLSRLDGIFARLGLTPPENSIEGGMKVGGQSVNDIKLEACREQLICLMYSSPAKYAPYSNLVSAQLSRELNELRRPVSDNPEILRFFRYMRAARQGQEGTDCVRAHPACLAPATPAHTMIAAYHDINKLVTARKLTN